MAAPAGPVRLAVAAEPHGQPLAEVAEPPAQPLALVAEPLTAGPPQWLVDVVGEGGGVPWANTERDLDLVELCSGQGELHKAF